MGNGGYEELPSSCTPQTALISMALLLLLPLASPPFFAWSSRVSRKSSGVIPNRHPIVTPIELPTTFAHRVCFSMSYGCTHRREERIVTCILQQCVSPKQLVLYLFLGKRRGRKSQTRAQVFNDIAQTETRDIRDGVADTCCSHGGNAQ